MIDTHVFSENVLSMNGKDKIDCFSKIDAFEYTKDFYRKFSMQSESNSLRIRRESTMKLIRKRTVFNDIENLSFVTGKLCLNRELVDSFLRKGPCLVNFKNYKESFKGLF